MDPESPHFAFPFSRSKITGRPLLVEQDTPQHVMACENVILRCPTGFRLDRPEFGVPIPEYGTDPQPADISAALKRWEIRSDVNASVVRDYTNRAAAIITVEIEVQ